ncbi:MAG: hypothetical protein DMF87_02150 [Acidobacteria bacterium]|nr:MAG: hypothetical protein DMF87_02150 [Acidobacteriota bacterium]
MVGRLEVIGDRLRRLRRRVGRECGERQQVINRRGFVLLLRKAVALREEGQLGGTDALDQPVVVLTDAWLRAGTPWRFEKDVQRLVELAPGRIQVAELKLGLASLEVAIRLRGTAPRTQPKELR